MTQCIYTITCTGNDRLYIGSTVNFRRRQYQHFNELRNQRHDNPKLQRAYNKYGEASFCMSIVEVVDRVDDIVQREQSWLDRYDKTMLYNVALIAGRTLGVVRTPETKLAMSKSAMGRTFSPETRERMRQAQLGKKRDPEIVAKITIKLKGQKRTAETKRKLSDSLTGNKNGVHTDEQRDRKSQTSPHRVAVIQKDATSGDIIAVFGSFADASRMTGAMAKHIKTVCVGKGKTAGGFVWEYA